MMIADFHPALLTPLSQSAEPRNERLAPHAPSPRKRCSERVSSLLLDNLELLQTPLSPDNDFTPNKKRCLQLHPRASSDTLNSALFQGAMERLRQKGMPQAPATPTAGAPRRIILSPRRRHVPFLPEPAARRESNGSTSDHSIKHDMERTPIRGPPERSNSGLARCA